MIGIAVILLILIPIWIYLIVPELDKIPRDYNTVLNLNHFDNTNFEINGNWTGQQIQKSFQKETTINVEGNIQVIEGWFKAETLNGELLFESKHQYGVNRKTRENVKGYGNKDRDGYYFFPVHLEKKSYRVWMPEYYYALDFNFEGVDNIQGIDAYYFKTKEFSTDDTEAFSFLDLVPETYGAGCSQAVEFWVEPVSGIIVNYKDKGMCYYTNKETGAKVQDMEDWSNKFNDDTIANQVRIAQNKKQTIVLYEWIIPILLGVIAVAFFIVSYIGRKKEEKE